MGHECTRPHGYETLAGTHARALRALAACGTAHAATAAASDAVARGAKGNMPLPAPALRFLPALRATVRVRATHH